MSREKTFELLQADVGREIRLSDWLEIDQERIDQFADATLDHQWIHVDPERAAASSPFGATVAHGFLTLSLIPHLLGTVSPDGPPYPGVRLSVNYGLNRVRFPHPVMAGARIRARVILDSVERVGDDSLQLIRSVTVELEGVEKPACVAELVGRLYFESTQ